MSVASIDNISGGGKKVTILNKSIYIDSNAATTKTINIRGDYPNYQNITIDNITVQLGAVGNSVAVNGFWTLTYSYSNGIITITSADSRNPFRAPSANNIRVKVAIFE